MSFPYQTKLDAIISILQAANTITSTPYLSNNLTNKIKNDHIYGKDPQSFKLRASYLPALFVRIANADEAFSGIGPTGVASNRVKKEKEVTFDVVGFYGRSGGRQDYETILDEVYDMAENIEAVFREKYNLSGTALWCNPETTDFLGPFDVEGGQAKTVLVTLKAKYLFN